MMNVLARCLMLFVIFGFAAGCAWRQTDKCYLPMSKYRPMKAVFVETGSMQRVEQLMEEQDWLECERRELRYLLAKDLNLDELAREVPEGVTGN